MPFRIRRVDYFRTTVNDRPGEAYQVLSQLAGLGINLLAFDGCPAGQTRTQLSVFPEETSALSDAAKRFGWDMEGPHPALLVQGDDELGALAEIHRRLYEANVNVVTCNGVADGRGGFGYVLHLRRDEFERASLALGV